MLSERRGGDKRRGKEEKKREADGHLCIHNQRGVCDGHAHSDCCGFPGIVSQINFSPKSLSSEHFYHNKQQITLTQKLVLER